MSCARALAELCITHPCAVGFRPLGFAHTSQRRGQPPQVCVIAAHFHPILSKTDGITSLTGFKQTAINPWTYCLADASLTRAKSELMPQRICPLRTTATKTHTYSLTMA
eukprot:126018-Pelagomonas_calceolata.AAC.4